SHFTALRNAISEWNSIGGSTIQLVEDTSPSSQARTDWASNSLHMLLFDEANSSGYFPSGSGTVAITPVWFYSSGRIADADVLFNGQNFSFTTSGQSGRYDIQDVAVHELGHLLGLDHSGWAGASMYPYVDTTVSLHRSLSSDEKLGMRTIYPGGSLGAITGSIQRASDNSVVRGAHVVVRDSSGRPVAASLTNASGVFSVGGLAADTYTLYATPLDKPVASFNLGSGWAIDTDFESTQFGNVTIAADETQSTGITQVAADVFVALGRNSDPYPFRCAQGVTTNIVIRGSGLNNGSTLTASDPSITVTPISWFGSQVSASVSVPSGSPAGHVDITIVDQVGDRSILTAPIEITPRDPSVTFVSPNQGSDLGGSNVTITGSAFKAGARVVVGGEIYVDGDVGGCSVLNSTTITLTTRPSEPGTSDVVVIDSSGVEGRKPGGFQFLAIPVVNTIYPPTGDSAGGTQIVLTGANFDSMTVVRISGVTQSSVFASTSQKLVVICDAGAVGGPHLVEVENSGATIATTQFSYSALADPVVASITPASGTVAGGDVLTVTGTDFGTNLRVLFGADPDTGLGGSASPEVVRVDSTTLMVTTPAGNVGASAVIVEDNATLQASVTTSGFTFLGSSAGGGGGCHIVPVQGPPDPGQVLRSVLWFALVAFGISFTRRRPKRSLPQRTCA
ncbi:MAG: hypothetical protein ACI9F9_001795, partial [Candidatus Paceibacteria bacterium]